MIQFYSPDIEKEPVLGPEEAQHCAKALRRQEGDFIKVTDGKGRRFECEVLLCTPRRVDLRILSSEEIPKNWSGRLELWVAPTKKTDRLEWMVEKAVEMGVDRIVPMVCDRSERKWQKGDRLERIALSAMKQSLKTHKPEIDDARTFADMLAEPFDGLTVMGYCNAETERISFARLLATRFSVGAGEEEGDSHNVRVLIGPEGDFSPEEVAAALEAGVRPVTFGNERLRTETAGLAAVQTFHVVDELIPCDSPTTKH